MYFRAEGTWGSYQGDTKIQDKNNAMNSLHLATYTTSLQGQQEVDLQ